MKKYVYAFGGGKADGDGKMKDVLGGKGSGLAEMSRAGVPVPPASPSPPKSATSIFRTTTRSPRTSSEEIAQALAHLEEQMGKKLGDADDPLLCSVRSGAKFSMPGMMNTILNLGLNDQTVEGLARKSGNPRFAYDCYRRFIQMFGEVALDIDMHKFDHIFDERKKKAKVKLDTELTADDLKAIIDDYKKLVKKETGKPFPQDAREQLAMSRDAVFRSWWGKNAANYRRMEKIPDDLGTAANVQAMVFGNMGDDFGHRRRLHAQSGDGRKGFLGRVPAERARRRRGGRHPHAASHRRSRVHHAGRLPAAPRHHQQPRKALSRHAGFRVHHRRRQAVHAANAQRQAHGRGGTAHRRRNGEGRLDRQARSRAARRTAAARSVAASAVRPASLKTLTKIANGIDASPGAAVGRAVFTADEAVVASEKGPVILIRKETTPDDIHGMEVAAGVLTAVGGKSSHAAVVARGMGLPCVVGAGSLHIEEHKKQFTVKAGTKDVVVKEGDWISFDGTTADVYLGQAKTKEPDPNSPLFVEFMKWADEFRGDFGVRANADIPRDAKAAREFGAEGIGLCRTEHMFFAADRIPHMQAMILAEDEKTRNKALQKLLPMQRKDFAGLFEAMDGYPVIIRTLDPPLHEFLPKRENLMVDIARLPHASSKEKKEDVGELRHPSGRAEEKAAGRC